MHLRAFGGSFTEDVLGGVHLRLKKKFSTPSPGFEDYPFWIGMAFPQVGNCCSSYRK